MSVSIIKKIELDLVIVHAMEPSAKSWQLDEEREEVELVVLASPNELHVSSLVTVQIIIVINMHLFKLLGNYLESVP